MAFMRNLLGAASSPPAGLETWRLRLPDGRTVSRQLPAGATDAQVRQVFAEDLASVGYRNPRRHQVQRPPLPRPEDTESAHSQTDSRYRFFMVPGINPGPTAAFVEEALEPAGARFESAAETYPGLPLSSGRVSAHHPTLGERIENGIRNRLLSLGFSRYTAQDVAGAARDIPFLGDVMTAGDAGSAFSRGNLLEGAGLTTLAMVGFIPGLGDVASTGGRKGLREIRRAAARHGAAPARRGGYHATDGLGNILVRPNEGPRTPPPLFQTEEEARRAAPQLRQRMSETSRDRRANQLGYSNESFWHGDLYPAAPAPLPNQYRDDELYFSRSPDYAADFARRGGRPEAREFRLRYSRPFEWRRMYSRSEVADILESLRRLDDEAGADWLASAWNPRWTADDFIADAARHPDADAADGVNLEWLLRQNPGASRSLVLREAGYDSINAGHEFVKLSADGIRLRSAEFDPRRADSLNINHAMVPIGLGLGGYGLSGNEED